jgi:hypothetical protein
MLLTISVPDGKLLVFMSPVSSCQQKGWAIDIALRVSCQFAGEHNMEAVCGEALSSPQQQILHPPVFSPLADQCKEPVRLQVALP